MRHRRRLLLLSSLLLMLLLVLVTSQSGEPFLQVTASVLANAVEPFRLYRQLQLRCDIESYPPLALDRPEVQHVGWVWNDELYYLTNDKKYTVYRQPSWTSAKKVYLVLTINSVTEEELGLYSCEARNTAGMYEKDSLRLFKGPEHIIYVEKVNKGKEQSNYDNVTQVMTSSKEADSQDEMPSSASLQHSPTTFSFGLVQLLGLAFTYEYLYV